MSIEGNQFPRFYITRNTQCPYLEDKYERKIFTHLIGKQAKELNNILTNAGFRRSQNITYKPVCDECNACISIRVLVNEFKPNYSMKRILYRNQDILIAEKPPIATQEQYEIFKNYINSRHKLGGMSDMSEIDFSAMVNDTFIDTKLIEYRINDKLVGTVITDTINDGLSMVYSFYKPEETKRSLGAFMILEHIERAKKTNMPYLYLGYLVKESRKMNYKSRFKPQEHLIDGKWQLVFNKINKQ